MRARCRVPQPLAGPDPSRAAFAAPATGAHGQTALACRRPRPRRGEERQRSRWPRPTQLRPEDVREQPSVRYKVGV